MTNYTHNNHLHYTINGAMFSHRQTPYDRYKVHVGKIDPDYYKKNTFRTELYRIADMVYKELGKDLVVFYSGGTDSEIVIRNFLDIGIKPRCVMIKLENDYNSHDIKEAQRVTTELGLPLELIDFNVTEFMNSGQAIEFSKKIQCSQVTFSVVYSTILKLGMPAVMGGSIPLVRNTKANPSYWYYTFRENEEGSAMRFSEMYNIPVIYEWYSYTPESMLYYLTHPLIMKTVSEKYNYKLTIESTKNQVLTDFFPEVRLRKKTHGYEKLIPFNIESYRILAGTQIMRLSDCLDGIPYYDLLDQLGYSNEARQH